MGGCAGKLNVDVARLASLPRQISFTRAKTQPHNSDPQVGGKDEGEKVENKVIAGNEDKNGGEEKNEAPLVDLSEEGEKSSSDEAKTDAAVVVPAESAESKVETPVEDNANPSTEDKVETPIVEVVEKATHDDKVETLVNDSSEEKAEAAVTNSEDKAEAAAVVVVAEEPEVKQPVAAPVNVPEEPAKEPEAKIEAVVAEETEAKQPETAPAKVEDKTDAASVAQ